MLHSELTRVRRFSLFLPPHHPVNGNNLSALSPYEEKALLARLAAGDADAFASLFNQYQDPLTQFILKFVKLRQLAEDLSQEVFLKIWQQRAKLTDLQSFRAFLFIVARNHTLNTLQFASRSQAAIGALTREGLSHQTPSAADDQVLTREYQEFLTRIIDSLPPRSREVFRLCREHQLAYDEVAAQLGISRHSVKNHMVHSMKILKAAVEKDLGIPLSLFLLILHGS
jgi:RNA polymerase sigma-70 factor (family 1)